MFENISDFLKGETSLDVDKTGEPTSRDLVVATVVLLLNMGHVDNELADEEFKAVISSMNAEFHLSDQEAGHMVEIADVLRKDPAKTARVLEAINSSFNEEQREHILSMLWKLVLADGLVEDFEVKYAAKLRDQLKLPLESSIRARKLAEKDVS